MPRAEFEPTIPVAVSQPDIEPEGSLPYSAERASGPYSESDDFSPHSRTSLKWFSVCEVNFKFRMKTETDPKVPETLKTIFIFRYIVSILRCKVKVRLKLSLCLTMHHAMKTYWGNGGIAPRILDFDPRWR
jgi:hypothetical protein